MCCAGILELASGRCTEAIGGYEVAGVVTAIRTGEKHFEHQKHFGGKELGTWG